MSAVETLGKYEIRRQLGRGAMGTVYKAWDPVIEREVAIKTIRLPEVADEETAEEIARFRREAQAAGRLNHPNIVAVFDYGETKDLAYIVMELVDGPPLKSLLDKNERFPIPTIVRIMEDLLAGLQFSHTRGVVHRDIKPANLMLTKAGQAKIADFGIARIESSNMTQAGTVLGTPAYMSPEQFMGQIVDSRTDIYSSGVLLYQLLTGERPFEGNMSAIMHKALNSEASPPSQISVTSPRAFDPVIRRAMEKRPEDRFTNADDFAAAIRAAAAAPVRGPDSTEEEDDREDRTMVSAPRSSATVLIPTSATSIGRPRTGAQTGVQPADEARKLAVGPIVIGAGVAGLAVLGGLGYFLFAGGSSPTVQPQPLQPQPVQPQPVQPQPVQPQPVQPQPVQPQPVQPQPVQPQPVQPQPVQPQPVQPQPVQPQPVQPQPVQPQPVQPRPVQPQPIQPQPDQLPVQPQPVRPAPDPQEALRGDIGSYLARLSCAMVDGDFRDGAVRMGGIGGKAAIDGIRQKLASLGLNQPPPSLRIAQIDPVFCSWADLLRPVAGFGETGGHLSLRLDKNRAWLVKDEWIKPRVVMGDFRGEIRVDYVSKDGIVMHLYPQLADAKEKVSGDPPRVFSPGETLILGEQGPGKPGWQVDEPYGTDMIVAIAAEARLFPRPRPGNNEKADDYLRDLQAAIDAARAKGVRITATAMPLETRLK